MNERQYEIESQEPSRGYAYKLDIERRGTIAYLVLHTGDSWAWLRVEE